MHERLGFWNEGFGRYGYEDLEYSWRARKAGYTQLELDVVADNASALALYKKFGFVEYGRNPKGFRSRNTGYQELVLMRLAL